MSSSYKRLPPYHANGTVDGTGGLVDLTYLKDGKTLADFITIQNTHATASLLISFDNGTTFATIKAGASFDLEWRLASVFLKSSAAATTYEIICTSGKQFRTIAGT